MKNIIFQLGTNNWQRQGEYAPGSGILHEILHNTFSDLSNTKCYSVYPSKIQHSTDEYVRIFSLDHDIPICESAGPVSSYRWHTMSEEQFNAYRKRLVNFVSEYINEIEEKENQPITHIIAHHSFLNPIIICDVNKEREINNKSKIPFSVFVHGTGLKMYLNELSGENIKEFPLRFTPLARKEDALNKAKNCFIISELERVKLLKIFPDLTTPITLSKNGVNHNKFFPHNISKNEVLDGLTIKHYDGSEKPIPVMGWDKIVVNVGRFADWKRLDCLLHAAAKYEKELDLKVLTIIAGTGPVDNQKIYMDMAVDLGLTNTYFVGPQPQDVLAQLYSISSVGVFPSFEEPMGMVFIECMACGTPVIGVNSGGPRDFVTNDVGGLIEETPTLGEDNERFCNDLADIIMISLKEDWKMNKGETCIEMVQNKYSTTSQVQNIMNCLITN